jgi:hypothetical protein
LSASCDSLARIQLNPRATRTAEASQDSSGEASAVLDAAATSVDGGCGGRVVRFVAGRTEGVYGLALEVESYVGVTVTPNVGVGEEFLDDDEVDALFQGRGGVT